MKRASKHENMQILDLVFSGGLNYAESPSSIADNELKRAMNFIYDASTDFLVTRPGTACQTAAALADPILKGYYYEKSAAVGYHVCASGGKLYYLTGASLNTWTEIGSLTDSTTVPSFLTFNNKLLIADGGTDIRTWDGTTYGTITGSPQATVLSMIRNRVVANMTTELDSVYLSAPNDAESANAWNTAANAIGLKAGYGDSLAVNAFGVFGDDLIVSKVGDKEKRLYRINVASATASNWYVQALSENNAAQNAHTMIGAWNNVFFVDSNGFKSVKGINEYGDLQVDAIGRKINTIFGTSYTCDMLAYLPTYNALWFNIGNRIFCYTERYDSAEGKVLPAFTDMNFAWGRPRSMYEAGDVVYLAGNDGYLHKIDETKATDETAPSTTAVYTCNLRTKTFAFFTDGILKKLQFYLTPKKAGAGSLYVLTDENTKTSLATLTALDEATYLYDATDDLYDATEFLYDTGNAAWVETTRNRIRNNEMAFELEFTSGRAGVEWAKAEIALVEGGN